MLCADNGHDGIAALQQAAVISREMELRQAQSENARRATAQGGNAGNDAEMVDSASSGDPNNPFMYQWTAVPLRALTGAGADQYSLDADLSALGGQKPLAVRLAWFVTPLHRRQHAR